MRRQLKRLFNTAPRFYGRTRVRYRTREGEGLEYCTVFLLHTIAEIDSIRSHGSEKEKVGLVVREWFLLGNHP